MSDHTLTLANGLKLGYAEYGDPRGEVAFYFHGWPSSRIQGSLFDAAAKQHGVRLICPDRPGIGLSDFQPGRTLFDWPETLTQLASHIGADNYHVIGWSGGGPYVLVTALMLPKRLLSASIICGAPPLKFLGDREMFWLYRVMIQLRHLPTHGPWLGAATWRFDRQRFATESAFALANEAARTRRPSHS